ncbi:hypothetical protein BC826DRAFT_1027412 [Russula brevipes]|nr:hypothetical protein BC826DRAFT_1027412 [Russula brevipes]
MLPWKILELVEHASDGNQYTLRAACLTARYFLPGAVHDILSAFRHASFPPQASLPFTLESRRFSDTFRTTALRSDEGYPRYPPILMPHAPARPPRARNGGGHLTRQPRQFRLAHCADGCAAGRHPLRAREAAQADGEGNSLSTTFSRSGYRRPYLTLAANRDLLRLTLEYLSDPGLYDTPAA